MVDNQSYPKSSGFDLGYAHALANRIPQYYIEGNFIHTDKGLYYLIDIIPKHMSEYFKGYDEGYTLGVIEAQRQVPVTLP